MGSSTDPVDGEAVAVLSHWGALERDQAIGRMVYPAGVLCRLATIVGGWRSLPRTEREAQPEPQEIR